MATRFYFSSTAPAAVNPPISATDWLHINPLRRALTSVNSGSAITTIQFSPDTTDHMVFARSMICQFVSEPMPPQMIAAQPVKMQIRCAEIATSNNMFFASKLYAVSEDGQTVLGTLLAPRQDDIEAATTLTNRSGVATTTAFVTSQTFRLVAEIGLAGSPTMAGGVDGHNGMISVGENSPNDLPEENKLTVAANPWLQFTHNLDITRGQSITYQLVDVCDGGCHLTLQTDVMGGLVRQLVYDVDSLRPPLTNLSEDERLLFLTNVLRINLADKTREEILADFEAGPISVTI